MFFKSRYHKVFRTKRLKVTDGGRSVTSRQELITGFKQEKLEGASLVFVGAGALASEVAEGVVRKGVGRARIIDHDRVSATNLSRQMFYKKDLHKFKAFQLAKNLVPHSTCGTLLEGFALSFQDALALDVDMKCSVAVVAVDNGETRVRASEVYRKLNIPAIFGAVDLQAESGYLFIQEPGKACFGCCFPRTMMSHKAPCRTPASKDVLKMLGGAILYALDTLLMERKRNWNHRHIHLAEFAPSFAVTVERRPDCPLCGTGAKP